MKLTDAQLDKNFGHLQEHEYRHFNRSLGCFVHGKEHFKRLMEQGGYVPYDMCEKMAEDYDKKNPKREYQLSKSARDIMREIKMTADRKGNIKLGGRAIKALREAGLLATDDQMRSIQNQLNQIAKSNS